VWDELDLDLKGLVLCYGDHLGNPALREQVAGESSAITTDQVLVTAGAAAALFIINTTLLSKGDHMIVAHPNYITNVETPRALGADVSLLPLRFEEGWRITADAVARLLCPETKLVSLTSPHNPTGSVLSEKELRAILALVEEKGCYLLMDETYRDMAFGKRPPLAASLSPRAISVSSLSKAYGLPGIRIGW
jgi:aspartate/methionine/tyrosine aminotransferase